MRLAAAAVFALLSLSTCGETQADLIDARMIEGDALPASLSGATADPARGQTLFASRDGGHCVLCHRIESLDAPFQGDVGPDLTGVGARLSLAQIRLRIADPSRIWPKTLMPSYYRTRGLNQVAEAYQGEPILKAQDIEDIAAYLFQEKGETDDR